MKQIIKTLALSLIVSLGLVACNDNEDFDDFKVNYPGEVPTGFYESGYTIDNDFEYSVLLQNENGNTVCQVFRKEKTNNNEVTILSDTIVEYNDTLGVFTAMSTAENNFLESNVIADFAIKQNGELTFTLNVGGMNAGTVNLHKSNGTPTATSIWANEDFTMLTELTNDTITGTEDADFDGKRLGILVVGEKQIAYAYTFENGQGSFITVEKEKGTLAYNNKYQLVVNFGGQTFTCNRLYSTPAPEVFTPIATGTFHYGMQSFTQDGSVLFDESMNHKAELGQSVEASNRFCIKPWLGNENGLVVVVDDEGVVTVPKQFTGFADKNYGEIFGQDIATALSMPEMVGQFDGSIFALPMAYLVSAGAVGYQLDAFVIEELAQPQSVNKVKTVNSKAFNSFKKSIKIDKLVELKK